MDRHNLGYISINNFANWVSDSCGFQICDEDMPALETSLDGCNDYRIMKDAFIETVSVPADDDEEEANTAANQRFTASASAQAQKQKSAGKQAA